VTRRGEGMDCPTTLREDLLDDAVTAQMEAEGQDLDQDNPQWDEIREQLEDEA